MKGFNREIYIHSIPSVHERIKKKSFALSVPIYF